MQRSAHPRRVLGVNHRHRSKCRCWRWYRRQALAAALVLLPMPTSNQVLRVRYTTVPTLALPACSTAALPSGLNEYADTPARHGLEQHRDKSTAATSWCSFVNAAPSITRTAPSFVDGGKLQSIKHAVMITQTDGSRAERTLRAMSFAKRDPSALFAATPRRARRFRAGRLGNLRAMANGDSPSLLPASVRATSAQYCRRSNAIAMATSVGSLLIDINFMALRWEFNLPGGLSL